jgi:predicted Zn-dependent protease
MADPDRRPTAQEIEELIDLVRRDPSSPAFIDLGEAYLALGRPKDAITVGMAGLERVPDSLEGRLLVARAHASLHQWKEAQGELLRVVKNDRSSRVGFALLGEVLVRRNDFERAVPVLQHAQNLDPTSPQILSMLKRARAGQTLDPPPAVPQPMPPRGETNYGIQLDMPKAASAPVAKRPLPGPSGHASVPVAAPAAKTIAVYPQAPAAAPTLIAHEPSPPPRAPKPTSPPPTTSPEGVRPRVVPTAKPQNAAAASLRTSASVGENYLNDLLTGGLLDVAGVRVPDAEFDLRPDRRWGRSTRRAFIFLFVVLVLGIGGGGGAYWWSEKQKAEAVARLQKEAKAAIGAGDFAGLELSLKKLGEALDRDPNNLLTLAYVGETTGLEALLYGADADRVDLALKRAAHDIKADQPGSRELLVGRAALELSRLAPPGGAAMLGDVQHQLDEYIGKHDDDRWARWLKGRALLAAGERKNARAQLAQAANGDDGLPLAMIDEADLLVDDGQLDQAVALYDKVLAKTKDHPLAVLGKALARAESSVQTNDAIEDLNVKLEKRYGPRVDAYRNLALAYADAGIEDYAKSVELLRKSIGSHPPIEPRFFARVAWLWETRGDLKEAASARARVVWWGKGRAEDEPEVQLVDAGLLFASGKPEQALDIASKLEGVRARILRAYAELDLNKPKDAQTELDEALKQAPDSLEAQILREQAKMITATEKDRPASADALEKLARKAKSKLGRHALGMAYFAVNDWKDAQPQLEQAVADLTDDAPNPLAYRAHVALAEIALAVPDIVAAGKHLDAALTLNSGYFPALALQAKTVLRNGEADRALDLLRPLTKEQGAVTPAVKLTLAEALVSRKDSTAQDKEDAKGLLEEIKDKIDPPSEVGRVAAMIDPKLPEKLGVPVGDLSKGPPPPKHGGGHHH